MTNAKLKKQFTNLIEFHYERELWHSRPEEAYEESIEPFISDLIRVVKCFKLGKNFKPYEYDTYEMAMPSITDYRIGQKIKEFRIKRGLSLAQLARKAEVNSEYLLNIERGESILRLSVLEHILCVLKIKSASVFDF